MIKGGTYTKLPNALIELKKFTKYNIVFCHAQHIISQILSFERVRVFIVEFIVGNTVEFVNVTINMTMNPTNSDKASENRKKKRVLAPTQN